MRKSTSYIVTDTQKWVKSDILEDYIIKEKSHSKNLSQGTNSFLEPKYNPSQVLDLLEKNTVHKSCCTAIARDVAGANYDLIPQTETPNMNEKEVLTRFFDSQNILEKIFKIEYDAEACGYGVLEIVHENGEESPVKEINHFPPHDFQVHDDRIRAKQTIQNKTVWFKLAGEGEGLELDYKTGTLSDYIEEEDRANSLLLLNRYNPKDPIYGIPPVASAIPALYGDFNRARYNNTFFKNYGVPALSVVITGDFDPETDEEGADLKEKISESLKEVIKNPHSAWVLQVPSLGSDNNVNVDITPLSVTSQEASFEIFRKSNRDEIIQSHQVDPSRISLVDEGKLNSSSSQQLDTAYRTSVIDPYRAEICNLINQYIVKSFNISDWEFVLMDYDVDTTTQDIENVIKLVQNGLMTPNEAREIIGENFNLGRASYDEMNDFYYNGTLLTNSYNSEYELLNTESTEGDEDEEDSEDETFDPRT